MENKRLDEKDIKHINKDIKKLQKIKKKLSEKQGFVFCPICKKLYPEEKCTHGPKMFGDSVKKWQNTCPQGHHWDIKHD